MKQKPQKPFEELYKSISSGEVAILRKINNDNVYTVASFTQQEVNYLCNLESNNLVYSYKKDKHGTDRSNVEVSIAPVGEAFLEYHSSKTKQLKRENLRSDATAICAFLAALFSLLNLINSWL